MEVIKEPVSNYDQMAIMEQYERVIAYLYPIAQSIPRRHGIARDMFLKALFGHVGWSNCYNLYTWLEKKHENNYQY